MHACMLTDRRALVDPMVVSVVFEASCSEATTLTMCQDDSKVPKAFNSHVKHGGSGLEGCKACVWTGGRADLSEDSIGNPIAPFMLFLSCLSCFLFSIRKRL